MEWYTFGQKCVSYLASDSKCDISNNGMMRVFVSRSRVKGVEAIGWDLRESSSCSCP